MKTSAKLKTVVFLALVVWSKGNFAQVKTTMYVMKNGEVVFHSQVSNVDNITFDKTALSDTLFVHKNDGSPVEKIQLNNIQQLFFSNENLFVEILNSSKMYAFDNIAKLFFDDSNTTGIHNPSVQSGFDVIVSVTPIGDMIVKSSIAINLLTLFSVDSKMISKQQCNGIETERVVSLQGSAAGIYLLRVETAQGTIVRKVVKQL